MDARELLALAYIVIGFGMLFVIRHIKAGKHVTLSKHAAHKPLSFFVFGGCLSTGMLLLSIYVTQWLVPYYQLPPLFLVAFLFGVVSVLAVAWIPDSGSTSRLHMFAAYCIIVSQVAQVGLLLAIAPLSILAWLLAWLMLMAMFVICYLLFFRTRTRQIILLLEMMIFMTYPAALLAVTYF